MFKTIEWTEDGVRMIDQTRLPAEETYVTCRDYREVAEAIRSMVIRGAPAIGVAASKVVALAIAGICVATSRVRILTWANYWYAALVVWNLSMILSASVHAH